MNNFHPPLKKKKLEKCKKDEILKIILKVNTQFLSKFWGISSGNFEENFKKIKKIAENFK